MSKLRRTPFVTSVADLYGHRRCVYVLRNGALVPIAGLDYSKTIRDRSCRTLEKRSQEELVGEIWCAVGRKYNEWVSSGLLTLKQLRLIRLLLFEDCSLREVARREGVSSAAISDRIERIRDRAPEFYRWWTIRNAIRRHAAQQACRQRGRHGQ